MKSKGFTLIELLLVVGIIGIVSAGVVVALDDETDRAKIEIARYQTRALIAEIERAKILGKTPTEIGTIIAGNLNDNNFGDDRAITIQTIGELGASGFSKPEVIDAIQNLPPDIVDPNTLTPDEISDAYDNPPVTVVGDTRVPDGDSTIAQAPLSIPIGNVPFGGVHYDPDTVTVAQCQSWEEQVQEQFFAIFDIDNCGEITDANLAGLSRISFYELVREDFPNLRGLSELTEIRIYLNPNLTLVEGLEELTSLERLQIYSNPQFATPPDLSGVTTLTYLNLNNNALTSAPDLTGLVNLRNLHLRDNPDLTTFPVGKPALFVPNRNNCSFHGTGLTKPTDPSDPWYNCRYKE